MAGLLRDVVCVLRIPLLTITGDPQPPLPCLRRAVPQAFSQSRSSRGTSPVIVSSLDDAGERVNMIHDERPKWDAGCPQLYFVATHARYTLY